MKLLVVFMLIGCAFAQYEDYGYGDAAVDIDVDGDVDVDVEINVDGDADDEEFDGVRFRSQWPQNSERLAGAIGAFALGGAAFVDQTCSVSFPEPVEFFHVFNGYFVPDSYAGSTDSFTITAPDWTNTSTEIGFLINFMNGTDGEAMSFNATEVDFSCGGDAGNLGVYSTIVDERQLDVELALMNREGFYKGDAVQVNLPGDVFNVTIDTRTNITTTEPEDLSGPISSFIVFDFSTSDKEGEGANDLTRQLKMHMTYADGDSMFHAGQVSFETIPGDAPAEE